MILFFGPPGSGKSVQGQLLVNRNQWEWLSTGELFRKSKDTEVLSRLSTGELIDDDLTNRVLDEALSNVRSDIKVVVDGYPRNVNQVTSLVGYLTKHHRSIDCVLVFEVPREVLIKRLTGRGRTEDSMAVIGRRLDIYEEKTKPVVRYYQEHNIPVIPIDGTGSVDEVHERIQKAIEECQKTE